MWRIVTKLDTTGLKQSCNLTLKNECVKNKKRKLKDRIEMDFFDDNYFIPAKENSQKFHLFVNFSLSSKVQGNPDACFALFF
jgi:hypothetical protein